MPKLFLVESLKSNSNIISVSNEVLLHENILEVLFKYKETLCHKFDDVRGTLLIDHAAITIIDSDNKIIVFSTTPSVEYNIISQDLWKHDASFSLSYQAANRFYTWEKAYENEYFEELKLVKEVNHGFYLGFNLSKKVGSTQFIYSFATRHQRDGLVEYYRNYINELFAIGDYLYKSVCDIYEKSYGNIITIPEKIEGKAIRRFSPFLKLISNKSNYNES